MPGQDISSKKPIGTREWYDFVGQLGEVLTFIHQGGQEATDRLLEMCQLDPGSQVLDVGCGVGNTACIIAERYDAYVTGIDISEVMIEKAKDRARRLGLTDQVTFRTADVFELPFEDGSFDVIIIESVLVPLPGDVKAAFKEMVRVLRPGGRIAANEATIDPSAPPELISLVERHPAFYRHFTPETLRRLFEESGLQVLHMIEEWGEETPKPFQGVGFRGVVSFMLRDYPKLVSSLLRDARLREARKIDEQVTRLLKQHAGYALIIGQKPE
ncbi:MAG: methyltransferase domain-containing protein [Anaerolineales bacterium]|nr:methyltransferase domain-containing protein [Anaerolineales bacterium]